MNVLEHDILSRQKSVKLTSSEPIASWNYNLKKMRKSDEWHVRLQWIFFFFISRSDWDIPSHWLCNRFYWQYFYLLFCMMCSNRSMNFNGIWYFMKWLKKNIDRCKTERNKTKTDLLLIRCNGLVEEKVVCVAFWNNWILFYKLVLAFMHMHTVAAIGKKNARHHKAFDLFVWTCSILRARLPASLPM